MIPPQVPKRIHRSAARVCRHQPPAQPSLNGSTPSPWTGLVRCAIFGPFHQGGGVTRATALLFRVWVQLKVSKLTQDRDQKNQGWGRGPRPGAGFAAPHGGTKDSGMGLGDFRWMCSVDKHLWVVRHGKIDVVSVVGARCWRGCSAHTWAPCDGVRGCDGGCAP